jgi:transcriptional regulator with XRE-family HTH domain
MSDTVLIEMIGKFIQQHRLNKNKSQSGIAKASDISRSALSLLDRGEKVSLNSLMQLIRVLDLLHIMEVFKFNKQVSPIEMLNFKK